MEWNKCSEKLPPKEGNILACNSNQMNLMYIAWYGKTHDTWKYTGGDVCGHSYEKPRFTHWMPLPDPPR